MSSYAHELAVYVGVHVLVVVLAKLLQKSPTASALFLGLTVALTVRRAANSGLFFVKYVLICAVSVVWLFRGRLDTPDGRLFMTFTLANVLVMAVPPSYNHNVPMTLSVLVLAAVTPRSVSAPGFFQYLRAYATVFTTYLTFAGPFRNNSLGVLSSVTPMWLGIATGDATLAVTCRIVGMLVVISLGLFYNPPVFGVSNVLPATPFRPTRRVALFTKLADAFSDVTDRRKHPLRFTLAMLLNAAVLAPLSLSCSFHTNARPQTGAMRDASYRSLGTATRLRQSLGEPHTSSTRCSA